MEAHSTNQVLDDNNNFISNVFNRQLLPAILSVAGVMISTMANSLIAGNLLDHRALAVLSLTSPTYFVFATIGALMGVGGSSLAAWNIGMGDADGADGAFSLAFWLALVTSLIITVLGLIFIDPVVTFLGAEGELYEMAKQYTQAFLVGGWGVTLIYLPYYFLKLEGRMALSVRLFLLLAVMNIGLDLLFGVGLGMGIVGIALGTAIANLSAALIGCICLLRKGSSFHLRFPRGHWDKVPTLLITGSPASLGNLCSVVRTIVLNLMILPLASNIGLSAFSVVTIACNLSLTVINGLSQTTSPFIGVFSSERDTASIRQLEKHALGVGLAIIIPVTILFMVFAPGFCQLFGISDQSVLDVAIPAVRYFAISLSFSMISCILVGYYLASGLTWLANLLTLCRAFLFIILSAFVLTPFLGVTGIWIAFTVTELLSYLVLAIAIALYRRKHPHLRGILLLDESFETNGRFISFAVASTVSAIMEASQKISDFCESNHLEAQQAMLISLSLEEILISIKDHCFPKDETQTISVRILIAAQDEENNDHVVVLRIRCSGPAFNPVSYYEENQATAPADSFGLGDFSDDDFDIDALDLDALDDFPLMDDSLGIGMIVSSAQMVDYQSTFGVNNLTILL